MPSASLLLFLYFDPSFYPEALHLAEKRANELEKKLQASEKAREKAEREAASVGDLRDRLHAAENALSEKEKEIAKREAAIVARFETQSARFSSNVSVPFHCYFACFIDIAVVFILKSTSFSSRENW